MPVSEPSICCGWDCRNAPFRFQLCRRALGGWYPLPYRTVEAGGRCGSANLTPAPFCLQEKDEFVENILADIKTLGVTFDRLTYTSDYFDMLLEQSELLINAGLLYADDTPVEQMREERMAMVESRCRGRTVQENLQVCAAKAASHSGL